MDIETINKLEEIAESYDIDPTVFVAFCQNHHYSDPDDESEIASAVDGYKDAYIGHFSNGEDFAEQWAEEEGLRVPEILQGHIDWQSVWDSELRHDFYELEGHYFRNI